MEHACLVSIVTPVFNQEKYIEEAINSVLSQTYPNIEYIVVDDGSTDNTPQILDKYCKRIKVLRQENLGQSAALNHGWSISTGSLLSYLSADDLLKPDCVEEVVKNINGYSVIYVDYDIVDADGMFLKSNICEDFDPNRMVEDLVCQPGVGAFFDRKAYESAGGWNTAIRQIPDFEFWLRLHTRGKFFHLSKNLGKFRIHDQSGSVKDVPKENSDEIIHVMSDFISTHPGKYDSNKVYFSTYLFSSRSHLQSGRYMLGLKRAFMAYKIMPLFFLKFTNIKFLVNGILRRCSYQVIHKLRNLIR